MDKTEAAPADKDGAPASKPPTPAAEGTVPAKPSGDSSSSATGAGSAVGPVHILAAPAPTQPKVRQISGGSSTPAAPAKMGAVLSKVLPPSAPSSSPADQTPPSSAASVTVLPPKAVPTGVTVTTEIRPQQQETMPGATAQVGKTGTAGPQKVSVTLPTGSPAGSTSQTIVLQTPSPTAVSSAQSPAAPSAKAATASPTAHIRIPQVPTANRAGPAAIAPKAVLPPTTTVGPPRLPAGVGRLPSAPTGLGVISASPATMTTVITTKAAVATTMGPSPQPQPAHQQVPSLPPATASMPANLTSKVGSTAVITAAVPSVPGAVGSPGQQPVSLAIIPHSQEGTAKVTVVHAPSGASGSQTLEMATKPAVLPGGVPVAMKPSPQGITMPLTIRQQTATPLKPALSPAGIAATNNPIQLVPISAGGVAGAARPSLVQPRQTLKGATLAPARVTAPGGILDSHSVRVTLIQSPATITKITSAQPAIASKPTLVATVGSQGPRHLVPQPQTVTQPIRIAGLQPAHSGQGGASSGTAAAVRNVTVIPSPTGGPGGATPIALTTGGAVGTQGTQQISVPIPAAAHQQQPQTQVARIITGGGGARVLSVPSSSVSIQKAFVTTVATTQQQVVTGNKPTIQPGAGGPNIVSLPYGATTITVPKPQVSAVGGAAVPVARVVPQSFAAGATATTAGAAAASAAAANTALQAFMSRPNQVPLAVSELQSATASAGKVTIAAGSPSAAIRLAAGGAVPEGMARLVPTSPSKPGILRRRGDLEREQHLLGALPSGAHLPELSITRHHPSAAVADSHAPQHPQEDGASSGSTTVSATSSPCDGQNLSGGEENNAAALATVPVEMSGPSPRKKPRKQQHVQVRDGPEWDRNGEVLRHKPASNSSAVAAPSADSEATHRPPRPSLLNSYRHTWKSRHNHFLRRSDVRVKEEPRPTVNELASGRDVRQKLNGWKVYHVSAQMEAIVDIEHQLSLRLSSLQRRLEKSLGSDNGQLSKDLGQVQEVIKANLQRSKVIQAQIRESRDNSIKVFDHKKLVSDILLKYQNKRAVKKKHL